MLGTRALAGGDTVTAMMIVGEDAGRDRGLVKGSLGGQAPKSEGDTTDLGRFTSVISILHSV